MEKSQRVRVVFRQVVLPATAEAPIPVAVNCWRLRMFSNASLPPIIDGVNFEFFNVNSPVIRENLVIETTVGGVMDHQGFPVYLNQTFHVKSSGASTGLLLVEEYIDVDARQNR